MRTHKKDIIAMHLVLIVSLLIQNVNLIICKEYYIVGSEEYPTCQPFCLTLSQFAHNVSSYTTTNTTLFISGGNHHLEANISVSNITQFSVISFNDTSINSSVHCDKYTSFVFSSVSRILISGLTLVGCDGSKMKYISQFTITHSMFLGKDNTVSSFTIIESVGTIFETFFSSNKISASCVSSLTQNSCAGGALNVTNTNLTIVRSQFDQNEANIGGAIYSHHGSFITINKSEFTSNLATSCYNKRCSSYGGALFINNSAVFIDSSKFQNNTSNLDGGAVVAFNSAITFSRCVLIRNVAERHGGAMAAFENDSITFDATTIEDNKAKENGGAVYVNNSVFVARNCNIRKNKADNYGGAITSIACDSIELCSSNFSDNLAKRGGVFSIEKCRLSLIDNCTMLLNRANLNGGGVMYVEHSVSLTISNSTLTRNSAAMHGGVLHINTVSNVTINDCNVQHNVAKRMGGFIYVKNTTNLLMNVNRFCNNKANVHGGVVFLIDSTAVIINQSLFRKNKANSDGGVFSIRRSGNVSVINCNFNSNAAIGYGGVTHLLNESSVCVENCYFKQNLAGREGGVIDGYSNTNIAVYRTKFIDNRAIVGGGAFAIMLGGTLFVKESVFQNNVESDLGAVIRLLNGTNTTIQNSNFTDNSANQGGVLLALRNNTIDIFNSTFYNNTARINGGTLYARTLCKITISNCSFTSNTADGNGVILVSDRSNIILTSSYFMSNEVGHDGGIAYIHNNCTLMMIDCIAISNRAGNSGGVVYGLKKSIISISQSRVCMNSAPNSGGGFHLQEDCHIVIETCEFMSNTADYGGVLRVYVRSTAVVNNSSLIDNRAGVAGGCMASYRSSNITVQECNFTSHTAIFGGVFYLFQNDYMHLRFENISTGFEFVQVYGTVRKFLRCTLVVIESRFLDNKANYGGVLYTQGSQAAINTSICSRNCALYDGGDVYAVDDSIVRINSNLFDDSFAMNFGGVIALIGESVININDSVFTNVSSHSYGGTIYLQQSTAIISNSTFSFSISHKSGGVIVTLNSSVEVENSSFSNNVGSINGGVICALLGSKVIISCCTFVSNIASSKGGVLYLADSSTTEIFSSSFKQNKAQDSGGAISTSSSWISITASVFNNNSAKLGAAIAQQESFVSFESCPFNDENVSPRFNKSLLNIIHSNVAESGGAIYLVNSYLYFGMETWIIQNLASVCGGGVHAENSLITIESTVFFNTNRAMHGGGMSLERSGLFDVVYKVKAFEINFISNQAVYGGALYVNDNAPNYICSANPLNNDTRSGCFFENVTNGLILKFNENSASTSGDNLFGGLLDRCSFVNYALANVSNGAAYFKEISNITNFDSVSSKPVRVCVCINGEPDCSLQAYYIRVKYRNGFSFQVAAVDQVNNTVTATVYSNYKNLNVTASQTVRRIDAECSNLEYYIFFPNALRTYDLNIYADGPCSNKSISSLNISIYVDSCLCPLGFVPDDQSSRCECICDNRFSAFSKYIQDCNASTGTVKKLGLFWITYLHNIDFINVSHTNPYFIHPYCPIDYCYSPSTPVNINLTQLNGSDAQCDNNRHGILCGSCLPNHSLSLGSSKCIKCPENWYGLLIGILIAAFFAGIILVFILLVLNLTVAVGTLNSIIFYANIINANRILYFRKPHLTFVPVFIAWLNLDIGFDTCFFEGMDIYMKTWIHLAFPAYIIILVVIIILISSYSSRFSNLIGKRNPVATLATLILLSYTRLLQTVIASFSFVRLNYPNGTTIISWLPNANIQYENNKLKLFVLVCVASCIVFVGIWYTVLIASWQWLLHCSGYKMFKWTRNNKLYSFIDTYHTPHTAKHRYWTGLLLLLRVIVYLVAAFSASSEEPITLLSTIIIMCCLLLYKTVWAVRVYRNWTLNAIESFMFFNTAIFALCTLYTFNIAGSQHKMVLINLQRVVAYISVGSTLFLFVVIIIFHMYRYGSAKLYSLLHPLLKHRKINTGYDHEMSHNDLRSLLTVSENNNIVLDAIDSPRTIRSAPFMKFNDIADTSVSL